MDIDGSSGGAFGSMMQWKLRLVQKKIQSIASLITVIVSGIAGFVNTIVSAVVSFVSGIFRAIARLCPCC
ncbi:hypothetical protein VTP01DRAFT_4369 [Rhizomucor pusillus]|uniref:uncharacterized protein n=1 Tax=Rhizomucor pusillus TaxID=4840 RepID=UPI003744210E